MNTHQLVEQGYLQFSEDEEENHSHQEPQNSQVQQMDIQNNNSIKKEQDHLLDDEEVNVMQETQNEENQEAIIKAMRYRSLTKSCVFIGFFLVLVGGLTFIYQYYAFLKGSIQITQYENLNIKIKNCNLYIFDYSNPIDSFLIGQVVSDLSITYHIPGSFNFDVSEPISYIKTTGNEINFHNVLSQENCFISLIATKKINLKNFNIHCSLCQIVSKSKDITFQNISIKGLQIDANLVRTEAKLFSFKALSGRLEMGYADIEQFSDLHLEKGDIIFQTDQEMMVNWTHANPYYALASPFMGNPTVIGCDEVSDEEKEQYLTGIVQLQNNSKKSEHPEQFFEEEERLVLIPDTDSFAGSQYQKTESLGTFMSKSVDKSQQEEELLFQPSCYGMILMCQDKDCDFVSRHKRKHATQIHFEATSQGSNTRQEKLKDWRKKAEQLLPHTIPEHRFLNVSNRFGNIYVNLLKSETAELDNSDLIVHGISYNKGELGFGLPSQKQLLDALKKASVNTNFDPIFKININSKASMTQDYQQYVLTYNPAYSYLRPWFLGAMTFGIMNSESQYLDLNLSPGYLPYRRGVTQEQIQKMQNLLNQYFNNNHTMTTFSWPNSMELPKERNETLLKNIPPLRVIPKDDEGRWILFKKQNETSYSLEEIKFSSNTILQLAYVISMILSYGIAISAVLLGVTYMSVTFRNLKDEFDSIKQYEELEHLTSATKGKQNKQTYQSQITQFISQLPPCQSFLDYLIIQYLNSKMNSAKEFCYLLFEPEDGQQQDIHDTSTESLNGMEMKLLYEKYCYLNGYIEKKLNEEEEIFKKLGFKFSQKQDAYTQAYCNVLIVQHFVQLEAIPETSNPLTLFIENCCKLTNFEEDNVPIEIFNAEYQQFCLVNQLPHESITNESLTRFNIKIQDVPQVWLVRIEENIDEKLKIKKICASNVHNQLKLLQDRPELIKKELNKAREKLILPHQWYLMDILISSGHVILTILIAIPFVQFTLLQEIFYQPYSLAQDYKIISLDDIIIIFPLIEKLPQTILIWMTVYLVLAVIDVIIYYQNAQYPQKKIFKLNWQNNRIQMLIRVIFWTLLACSLLQLLLNVFMAVMWLMLGAIVNPNAFLPYATASIAFFSIIMSKAQEFNRTLNEGFDSIIVYIKEATFSEWGELVNKMNLKGELHTLLQGDTMKYMFKQAADLGLTSPEFQEQLERNADDILTNPEKFASKAIDVAKNPQKIQEELLKSIEERAVEMMKVQFTKYLNQVGDPVTYLVVSLFKQDFGKVKGHIQDIMHLQLAEEQKFLSISDSTFDLIWEFGFGKHIDMAELESKSLSILSDMIIENVHLQMKPRHFKKILNECLNIVSMVCKQQHQEVIRPFEKIIHTVKKEMQLNKNNNNQMFMQVVDAINLSKLVYGIFKGEDSIHELFALVKDYLGQNKILNLVEFLLYCNHNCCSLEIESLDLQLTNKDESNLYIKKLLCYSKKHITQQNLGNAKQLWSQDYIKFYGEDYDQEKLQPLIQGLFNLSQFALDGNQRRLLKIHADVVNFSINKHFCFLVNKALIIKYGRDLQEPIFKDNPIIEMLGRYLNISIQQMLNILMEIFYEPQEWSILYLSQIYRIPKESVRICFYILNIFRSKDELTLFNSLQGLHLSKYFNLVKAFKGTLSFRLLQQRPKTFKLEDSIQTSWAANGNIDMKNLEHVLLRAACDETVFISYSNVQDIVTALANQKNGLKEFSLKEIEFLNTLFKIRAFSYNKISDIESASAKEQLKNFTTVYSLEYGRFMDVMNFLILNNPKKRFNLFVKFQKTTNTFLIPNKEYNDFQVYLKYLSQNYKVLETNQTFVEQTLNKIVCMDEQMPQLKLLVPHILTFKQGPLDSQFYNILTFENQNILRIVSQKVLSPQEIENSCNFQASPGQKLIFKMINDPIQHYMDYISEILDEDELNYVALQLFLQGKSKNIQIRKQPILEFISQTLNINTEYLESFHIFYQRNVSKCSSKILRLVKRHAQQKQANIPIKLLITLNENQVKQILQLATGEELAVQKLLPQIDVQFLQFLTLLQQLKSKTVQQLIPQFRSLNQLFQTLDVKTEEFITILQLLYCPQAKQIKEGLRLENVQLLKLQENLKIDSVIDYNSPEEYVDLYNSFKESSTLKLQFNQYDYNYVNKFLTLLKGISQAHVGCLSSYFENIQFLECGQNFQPILKGLIGCIGGDLHKDFNLDTYLRQGKGESQVEKALMNMRKIEVNPLLILLACGIKRGWVYLPHNDIGLVSYALFKFNSYKKQEQHFISTLSWQRSLKQQLCNKITQQFNQQRHEDVKVILKNNQDLETIINLLNPNEQQRNSLKELVELYLLINDQALYEVYRVLEPERVIDWKQQAKLLGFRKDLIEFLEQFYLNHNYELQLLEIGMEGQEPNQRIQEIIKNKQQIPYDSDDYEQIQPIINICINLGIERVVQRVLGKNENAIYNLQVAQSIATLRTILTYNNEEENKYRQLPKDETVYDKINDLLECIKQQLAFSSTVHEFSQIRVASLLGFSAGYVMTDTTLRDTQYGQRFCDYQSKANKNAHIKAYLEYFNQQYSEGKQDMVVEAMYRSMLRDEIEADYIYDTLQDEQPQAIQGIQYHYQSLTQYYNIINSHTAQISYWLNLFKGNYEKKDIYVALLGLSRAGIKSVSYENILHQLVDIGLEQTQSNKKILYELISILLNCFTTSQSIQLSLLIEEENLLDPLIKCVFNLETSPKGIIRNFENVLQYMDLNNHDKSAIQQCVRTYFGETDVFEFAAKEEWRSEAIKKFVQEIKYSEMHQYEIEEFQDFRIVQENIEGVWHMISNNQKDLSFLKQSLDLLNVAEVFEKLEEYQGLFKKLNIGMDQQFINIVKFLTNSPNVHLSQIIQIDQNYGEMLTQYRQGNLFESLICMMEIDELKESALLCLSLYFWVNLNKVQQFIESRIGKLEAVVHFSKDIALMYIILYLPICINVQVGEVIEAFSTQMEMKIHYRAQLLKQKNQLLFYHQQIEQLQYKHQKWGDRKLIKLFKDLQTVSLKEFDKLGLESPSKDSHAQMIGMCIQMMRMGLGIDIFDSNAQFALQQQDQQVCNHLLNYYETGSIHNILGMIQLPIPEPFVNIIGHLILSFTDKSKQLTDIVDLFKSVKDRDTQEYLFLFHDLIIKEDKIQTFGKLFKKLEKNAGNLLTFGTVNIPQIVNGCSQLYTTLMVVVNQPNKSISDKQFQGSILQLLQDLNALNLNLPIDEVNHIMRLLSGEIRAVVDLIRDLRLFDQNILLEIEHMFDKVESLGIFNTQIKVAQPEQSKILQDLMEKIKNGSATAADIFKVIDEDKSNSIDQREFGMLSRRLGMELSSHRIMEIFAEIKKNQSDQAELDLEEFEQSLQYLNEKNSDMALEFLGISKQQLLSILITIGLILLFIFLFIFLGIQAFALGGTFGAVINSILPMIFATSTAQSFKQENKTEKEKIVRNVKKSKKLIQSNKI